MLSPFQRTENELWLLVGSPSLTCPAEADLLLVDCLHRSFAYSPVRTSAVQRGRLPWGCRVPDSFLLPSSAECPASARPFRLMQV